VRRKKADRAAFIKIEKGGELNGFKLDFKSQLQFEGKKWHDKTYSRNHRPE